MATPPEGTSEPGKSNETSSTTPVLPGWRKVDSRGPIYTRDADGRIRKLPDPEPLELPRPDVWIGRVWRDGGYAAVVVESRNGIDISRYEVLEDNGPLNPAWEAILQYVRGKWNAERYGR